MAEVMYCENLDCNNNQNGECTFAIISINSDGKCDYES